MKNVRIRVATFDDFDNYRDYDLTTGMPNWLIRCIESGYEIAIVRGYLKRIHDDLTVIKRYNILTISSSNIYLGVKVLSS